MFRCCAPHVMEVRLWAGPWARGSSGKYLSEAIHGFHADKLSPQNAAIACYDCHPGAASFMQPEPGTYQPMEIAWHVMARWHRWPPQSLGTRVPWVNEPPA